MQGASAAEDHVVARLRATLPRDARVLTNRRIFTDDKDLEIDVLVLWPGVGIVVLEVKGGRVGVEKGRWYTEGSRGKTFLDRSPVEQALEAKYAFKDYMHGRSSRGIGRVIHMAALPYTDLPADWDAPDAPRSILIDASQMTDPTSAVATALRHQHVGVPPADADQVALVEKAFRATHRARANARTLAQELEDRGNALTREQDTIVDVLRFQHRAELSGGPGSGKTHLALLKARTLAREGRRVALMCYSRGLARYFQLMVDGWPEEERPAYVGLFHDLPVTWEAVHGHEGRDYDSQYWEESLPRALMEHTAVRPKDRKFDAIVVDEGQDFSDLWWQAVLGCLREPDSEEGVLWVFTDDAQRIFDRDGIAPVDLNPFWLGTNLRNAQTVAEAFAPLAPFRQEIRNVGGHEVTRIDSGVDGARELADEAVEALLQPAGSVTVVGGQKVEGGWEPEDVALLTTGSRHPVQKETVEVEGWDGYWDGFFSGTDVFYGHVLGFKGLERKVVVLAINGFSDAKLPVAKEMLYVGMSRAKAKLVVVGDLEWVDGL